MAETDYVQATIKMSREDYEDLRQELAIHNAMLAINFTLPSVVYKLAKLLVEAVEMQEADNGPHNQS